MSNSSKTIDERVVSMQFDNKDFEKNVQTSMNTLDKLKKSLNMDGAAKGLSDVNSAAKNVDMSGLSDGVQTVTAKFSALQVMAITALSRITNAAITTGTNLARAVTIEPILSGLQEYETQINSVQTIMANTASQGTTLNQVNDALDELNLYADKTIYNFTEMTRNIGTFTAAGVDLDTSVSAIQGIANLAAVSGSTSQQASVAMYQLSQALAAGTVKLMDWNSVVNAGMGGQVFQTALRETSEELKTGAEAAIKAKGSFRESLQTGWLTSEVLTSTLKKFTTSGANEYVAKYTGLSQEAVESTLKAAEAKYGEADAIKYASEELAKKSGKNAKEIQDALEFAETAEDAATKVKTFTQLIDTLKEGLQSGWTQSWEMIIGDFEEAKELYTGISDTLGGMINDSANARNKLLTGGLGSGWKEFLSNGISNEADFKDTISSIAKKHNISLDSMIEKEGSFEKTLKKGWLNSDLLTESVDAYVKKLNKMSSKQLENAGYTKEQVEQVQDLQKAIKSGSVSMDDFAEKMTRMSGRENIIKGFGNLFDLLSNTVKPIKEGFDEIFPAMTSDQLYDITKRFKEFTEKLKLSETQITNIKDTFKGLFSILDLGKKAITTVISPLISFLTGGAVSGVSSDFLSLTAAVGRFFTKLNEGAESSKIFTNLSNAMSIIAGGASELVGLAEKGISAFSDILSNAGEAITNFAKKVGTDLSQVFEWFKNNIPTSDIFTGLTAGGVLLLLDKVTKFFNGFGGLFGLINKIKGMMSGTMEDSLSDSMKDGVQAFTNILHDVHDSLSAFTEGLKVASFVAIAGAITLLTNSVEKLSNIKADKIAVSLVAIKAMMMELNSSFNDLLKSLQGNKTKGLMKSATTLMLLAKAVDILATAVTKLSKLSWENLAKGLAGAGTSILALSKAVKYISDTNISLKTSVALIALAEACKKLSDAVVKFGGMSWEEITKGLIAMGGALTEFTLVLKTLNGVSGTSSLAGSTSILIASDSLDEISQNLKRMSGLSWDSIAKGLTAMAGALAELGTVSGVLGKLAGMKGLVGASTLVVSADSLDEISQNLKRIGSMGWEQIEKGLNGMGGALAELAVVSGALGKLTGLYGLIGGSSLVVAADSLDEISQNLKRIGSLSWDQIEKGLQGMGGALTELGVVSGVLGKLTGLSGLIGAGSLVVAADSLDEISQNLKRLAKLSWDDIQRGLTAMGGALTELAVVSGATGFLTGLAGLVGAGTITLAVQGLNQLADGFLKFSSVGWDQVKSGLTAMGGALAEISVAAGATGYLTNFMGLLGAGTIKLASTGLEDLANGINAFSKIDAEAAKKGIATMSDALVTLSGTSFINSLSLLGSLSISVVAEPLGKLADSMKKWVDVKMPSDLPANMLGLAQAVQSFTFSGLGSLSISAIGEPLGKLADSIKKWKDVTVPSNIKENLEAIADGVKAFSWLITGSYSLSEIATPIGTLADSVKKWADVTVPESLVDGMDNIAEGIKKFTIIGAITLNAIAGPIGKLATAFTNFASVSTTDTSGIVTFSTNIKSVATNLAGLETDTISTIVTNVNKLATMIKNVNSTDTSKVESFVTAANKLNDIKVDGVSVDTSGLTEAVSSVQSAMTSISNTMSSSKGSISSAMTTAFSGAPASISNYLGTLTNAVKSLISGMISAIDGQKKSVTSSFENLVSGAATAIRTSRSGITTAGKYLGEGLVAGIKSKFDDVYDAAYALGQKAVQGEMDGQNSASPSKAMIQAGKYLGEGLIIGIDKMNKSVYDSSYSMGETATNSISNAVARISEMMNSDIDVQPTIRPVVDLSNVSESANSINSMFSSTNPSVGVLGQVSSISSAMNANQNRATNDDVVYALNKLGKALNSSSGDTYNINGITYDDGSNISSAVQTLVNAARVERRR